MKKLRHCHPMYRHRSKGVQPVSKAVYCSCCRI